MAVDVAGTVWPVTVAAADAWVTVPVWEPIESPGSALRPLKPRAAAPVDTRRDGDVVTIWPSDETPDDEASTFAWASWLTVKASEPVWAPAAAVAVATSALDVVAVARFHDDCVDSALAAVCTARTAVFR